MIHLSYYSNFAKFEVRNKEIERAREIFKFGLDNLPKDKSQKLYDIYLTFEKQYGAKEVYCCYLFLGNRHFDS